MNSLYFNNSGFIQYCKVDMKRRKQNHKISFHFFAAPPCTPRRLNGLVRKFLVLVRDQREREARIVSITTNPNAYVEVKNHHALRALQSFRASLEKGSCKGYNVTAD